MLRVKLYPSNSEIRLLNNCPEVSCTIREPIPIPSSPHHRAQSYTQEKFDSAKEQWYTGYLATSSMCLITICWCFPFSTTKSQWAIWKQDILFKIFFFFFFQIFKKYLLKLVNGIRVRTFRLIFTGLFDQFFLSLVEKDYPWAISPLSSNLCRRSDHMCQIKKLCMLSNSGWILFLWTKFFTILDEV